MMLEILIMFLHVVQHLINTNKVFQKNQLLKKYEKNAKIAVPLKYLSNFWISLEMPLINCKIHLELNWTENSVMSGNGDENNSDNTKFKITNPELYVPIVTLSTGGNVK